MWIGFRSGSGISCSAPRMPAMVYGVQNVPADPNPGPSKTGEARSSHGLCRGAIYGSSSGSGGSSEALGEPTAQVLNQNVPVFENTL